MAADLLTRVLAELEGRLAELRPAVVEYERLRGAANALESSTGAATGQPYSEVWAPTIASEPAAGYSPSAPPGATRARATRRRAAVSRARARVATGRRRGPMTTVEKAIVAALEHGSHTIAELGVVTAMSAPELRDAARRLLSAGKIVRASREGRTAYARPGGE